MASGYTPSANPNKRLYNGGSEWQDDIDGLAVYYSTFFREYDAVIGRFNGVDPIAEVTDELSTYAYSGNNPIMMNDPLGDISRGRYSQDDIALFNAILNWHNKYEVERMSVGIQNSYFLWHSTNFGSLWNWNGGNGGNMGGPRGGAGPTPHELVNGNNTNSASSSMGKLDFALNFYFYETEEAAASAWGYLFNGGSILDDKEYSSVIFKYTISGKWYYSFSVPTVGSESAVKVNYGIPRGATITAIIHSHAKEKKKTDNNFSLRGQYIWEEEHYDSDLYSANKNDFGGGLYSLYLTTPDGHLKVWTSGKSALTVNSVEILSSCMPSKANDAILDPCNNLRIVNDYPGKSIPEVTNLSPVYMVPVNPKLNFGKPIKVKKYNQ